MILHFVFGGQIFGLLSRRMLHVRLVANEEDALLGNALLQSLIEVIVAPFDARFIRKIKDNHTPLRTFEVGGSEGSKLLLPGCVPDLQ